MAKSSQSDQFVPVDPAVRAREFLEISKLLNHPGPVTQSKMDDWIRVSADRKEVFRCMFFGTIHWPNRSAAPAYHY